MEVDPKERHPLEYKSIVLDIIEKYKTYERVLASNNPQEFSKGQDFTEEKGSKTQKNEERKKYYHVDENNVTDLPEGLLYKFRKCKIGS